MPLMGLRRLWSSILDLLYPPKSRCLICDRPITDGKQICSACLVSISHPEGPLCPKCGRALADFGDWDDPNGCPYCLDKKWHFSSARSIGPYQGELRMAIHRLKFRGRQENGRALAQLMFRSVEREWWSELDLLVPVPLHSERLKQRGFNQAQLLSYELSLLCQKPMRLPLTRIVPTTPQTGLSQKQRRLNVQGAFQIAPSQKHQLVGKRVLLVDDVMTTGSTLDACAKALRQAGAAEVRVLTVAVTNLRPQ